MTNEEKNELYEQMLEELSEITEKYKVDDFLIISVFEGELRNSVLAHKKGTNTNNLFCAISDYIAAYMSSIIERAKIYFS